jgi:phosphohistidine phosphatase
MRLYLVRHGEALEEAVDPERPLSQRGVQEVALTGNFMKEIGAKPRIVLCSEKLRAKQTAERLLQEMGKKEKIDQRKGLAPKDNPEAFVEELGLSSSDMLIAGHSPFLPKLAALLLCGRADPEIFSLPPGGLLCLEREGHGNWRLTLSISPSDLAELS